MVQALEGVHVTEELKLSSNFTEIASGIIYD